jgi:hypothetical protein
MCEKNAHDADVCRGRVLANNDYLWQGDGAKQCVFGDN